MVIYMVIYTFIYTNQLFSSENGAVIYCGAELRTGHGDVPGSADAEIDMLQP